jgi:hypothetical protein
VIQTPNPEEKINPLCFAVFFLKDNNEGKRGSQLMLIVIRH